MVDQLFLNYSVDKLRQYQGRIQDCLARLSDAQIWMRQSDHENAIGNLVLHLCGNLRQWIGTGVAGLPDTRQRDTEFATREGHSREDLATKLHETIQDTVRIILDLDATELTESRRIQNYDVTVLEAVYHVVEHFAGHTGQIIFATKLFTSEDLGFYKHLSQAPGKSAFRVP